MAKRGNTGRRRPATQAQKRGTLASLMAMAMAGGMQIRDIMSRPIGITKNRHHRSKYSPHQGEQEKARRVRQGLAGLNMKEEDYNGTT